MKKVSIFLIAAVLLCLSNTFCSADDWPGFRGPNRDGKSAETGLLNKWPKNGPKLMWSLKGIGKGYSSPAIANGMIYVTGLVGKNGLLKAFDLNGNFKWKKTYGGEWSKAMPGVRCTPTVNEGRVYVISGLGKVVCFDAKSGDEIWAVDAVEDYNGKYGLWGVAESPLIDGGNLICTPGGDEATVMALDKITGRVVWKCAVKGQKNACCSPILIHRGGRRLIVTMLDDYTIGIDAQTGRLLWKDVHDEYQQDTTEINPVSPVYHDGCIYTTSGYDDGSAMLQLNADGSQITRKWIETTLDCHHGGVVLVDGYIYSSNWYSVFNGGWVCLNWAMGTEMYHNKWNSKGSIIYADGMLYCYDEKRGEVALVKPDPAGFKPVSSFTVSFGKGMHWAHPAISDGRLYMRHGDVMGVFDIKEKSGLFGPPNLF